jgi:hypothetical protein
MMNIVNHTGSSMIQSSSYDPSTQELSVTFNNGAIYTYQMVSEQDYNNFINSESSGQGFNQHIRKYQGTRMLTEDMDAELRNKFPGNVEGSSEFNEWNQLNG